jgi:hypothetical protein
MVGRFFWVEEFRSSNLRKLTKGLSNLKGVNSIEPLLYIIYFIYYLLVM